MLTSTQSSFADRLQSISRWASALTIVLGCVVLMGWVFNIPIFKSLLPGMNAMKVNTAICFLLCGLALWLLQPRPVHNTLATYTAVACAGLTTLIGLATLSQYAFGWNLHIDQFLFVDTTPLSIRAFPGRMVPATAVIFILLGAALLSVCHPRLEKFAEWTTFSAGLIALAAFIGLLYDAGDPSNLYLVSLYRGIALHTVAGAVVLCLGLLCLRPNQGYIAMFARNTPGGDMARRLLPMVISLPLLVGLLRQAGERMGLYPAEFGMALNTIIPIGTLVILIWQNARALDESDLIRRQSEQALRENEDKFRYIFDYSPVAKSITRPSGQIEVNQAFCEMLGYSKEELQGKAWQQITHPDDVQANQQMIISFLSGKITSSHLSKRYLHKNGSTVWADVRSTVRQDSEDHPLYFLTSVIDITERKQAESAMMKIQTLLNETQEITKIGGWEYDVAAKRIFWTDEVYRIHGVSKEYDPSDPLQDIKFCEAEDQKKIDEAFARAVADGIHYDLELRLIKATGEKIWVRTMGRAEKSDDKTVRIFGNIMDITERKHAEHALQVYTAKLEQSNRDLQEFAYIASHDLQEPLRKVQAFSDRLATKYADKFDDTGRDYLNRMRDASQRMQILINDLLILSRVATSAQPFSAIDLNTLAQEVLSNLENQIERAEGRVEIDGLPTIEADPIQIRQLLQNLIGNALKFHPPERHPFVKVSAKVEGVTCQILIEDNGIGFDTQYLDRIFKPFQRLHSREEYEGSGMGLAICRRIIERHGGTITATSTLGEGATFILTLPIHQPKEKNDTKA